VARVELLCQETHVGWPHFVSPAFRQTVSGRSYGRWGLSLGSTLVKRWGFRGAGQYETECFSIVAVGLERF
jgi:hypothetical protein